MYWNETVTVYHKSTDDSGGITWDRKTYGACFWQERSGGNPSGGARIGTATRVVRFPCINVIVSVGDIIVRGLVTDDIDEYTAGKRSSDLRKRHPKSFVVSSVHDNTGLGLPFPHTYTEGA